MELGAVELGERSGGGGVPPEQEQSARSGRRRRRLSPASVGRACRQWLKHPAHLALLAWTLCVAASGTMLGLLLLGALDGAVRRRSDRGRWVEINNQILNALFTLMTIYQHPALFHHGVLLLRWRQGDEKELRRAYCRSSPGDAPPRHRRRERLHMSVVVVLLHLTCLAQYAMCGLFWGYSSKSRPDAAATSLAVVGTVAPVLAGLYMYFSPLGRRLDQTVRQEPDVFSDSDDDGMAAAAAAAIDAAGTREWAGGLLDVGGDPTACWLSCLCTFCVFGWNMERLGFGNMHVHAVMFALLCFAPLWVLNIAAFNIRDNAVADVVGAAGVVLCALGLLYGGFWRARMRRKFGLRGGDGGGSRTCCGSLPSLADYLQWMFCWGCALAQEVRTGNLLLDVEAGGGQVDVALQPLPRENGSFAAPSPAAAAATGARPAPATSCSPSRGEESPLLQLKQERSSSREMRPPAPSLMQGEESIDLLLRP